MIMPLGVAAEKLRRVAPLAEHVDCIDPNVIRAGGFGPTNEESMSSVNGYEDEPS
jgi:hypothetical protein